MSRFNHQFHSQQQHQHHTIDEDDEEDGDIATVYSKEFSQVAAAMFSNKVSSGVPVSPPNPNRTPPASLPGVAIQECVSDDRFKIVGVDKADAVAVSTTQPTSANDAAVTSRKTKGATASSIPGPKEPTDMDVEWTTYSKVVSPNLLATPTPKVVESPEPAKKSKRNSRRSAAIAAATNTNGTVSTPQQPAASAVLNEQAVVDALVEKDNRSGCNRRWLLVLLLAGIFLTSLVLAVGLSIIHQQSQERQQRSPSASTVDVANQESEADSGTIAPLDDVFFNRPSNENTGDVDEPVSDNEESTPESEGDSNARPPVSPPKGKNKDATPSPTPPLTASPTSRAWSTTDAPAAQSASASVSPTYATKRVVAAILSNTPDTADQELALSEQLSMIDVDAVDFVVHLGNVRSQESFNEGAGGGGAGGRNRCKAEQADYSTVADILSQSPVPVFVLPGDRDWSTCNNEDDALSDWQATFGQFQTTYWNALDTAVDITLTNPPLRSSSFAMVYNDILFMGLTLPGALSSSPEVDAAPNNRQNNNDNWETAAEWDSRLDAEFNWTQSVIDDYQKERILLGGNDGYTGRVVLFGNANPSLGQHAVFFDQLYHFIAFELQNQLPVVYVNGGSGETWAYDTDFFGMPSFLHVTVSSGSATSTDGSGSSTVSSSTIQTLAIVATGDLVNVQDAFLYEPSVTTVSVAAATDAPTQVFDEEGSTSSSSNQGDPNTMEPIDGDDTMLDDDSVDRTDDGN